MPQRILIILCLTFFALRPLNAQNRSFIIKVAGIKIGKLDAYHIKNKTFDYYVTHSTVNFSFIMTLKADIKTESLYNDGVLLKATVTSTLNGTPYISRTVLKKNHYDIDCNTYKYTYRDTTLTKPIKWSAGKLYFEIPVPGDEVYTESYGKLGVLTETGKHALKMTSPKSKQVYYYNNDHSKIIKIEVINSIKNFEMFPIDTIR